MDTILIGTTAINRPYLHNLVFLKWKKWLLESGKKLVWVINIDIIEQLGVTHEDTKKNFEILLDGVDELIILPQQRNHFLGACKNISNCIKSYAENNNLDKKDLKIIWLEDDWELLDTHLTLNKLLEYSGQKTHINLSGIINNYIWALAPSILSYHFWEEVYYYAWYNQSIDIDAEKCVGNYFINNYCEPENVLNIIIDGTNTDNVNIVSEQPIFLKLRPQIALDRGIDYLKSLSLKKQMIPRGRASKIFRYVKI
jgi:hypothetical protein